VTQASWRFFADASGQCVKGVVVGFVGLRVRLPKAADFTVGLCRASTNAWRKALIPTSLDASIKATLTESSAMRTTLALDDDLLAKATALTDVAEKSALVREALRALIQRESATRRLCKPCR